MKTAIPHLRALSGAALDVSTAALEAVLCASADNRPGFSRAVLKIIDAVTRVGLAVDAISATDPRPSFGPMTDAAGVLSDPSPPFNMDGPGGDPSRVVSIYGKFRHKP